MAKYRRRGYDVYIGEGFAFLGPLQKAVRGESGREFICGSGWNTFTIMHNGEVTGCPALEFPEYVEGNIKNMLLEDIWQNKFKRFRGKYNRDMHDKCKKCKYLAQCRGGCWLYMVNGDPCFLEEAEEVAKDLGLM